jgi:membrane protein implicated in regulation of membrane protease activity
MAIETDTASRSTSFTVVLVGLVIICVGLGAMMFITIEAVSATTDQAARKLLARLSWLSLVLLCLAVLMTTWVVLRYVRHRLRDGAATPAEPSQYVNAWELAGKRFQLNEDNEPEDPDYLCDEEDEDDEEDDDGEQDRGPKDRWR